MIDCCYRLAAPDQRGKWTMDSVFMERVRDRAASSGLGLRSIARAMRLEGWPRKQCLRRASLTQDPHGASGLFSRDMGSATSQIRPSTGSTSRSRGAPSARALQTDCPLRERGRREGRVSADTRGPRAAKSTRQNHRFSQIPAFPAQWCYGCFVLSPVRRACWPPYRDNAACARCARHQRRDATTTRLDRP